MYKKILTCGLLASLLLTNTYATAVPIVQAQQSNTKFESNLFTQMEDDSITFLNQNSSLEGFDLVAENNYLELFVNPNSLAIKILNKETNYIWSSTLDNRENYQLNQTWQHFVDSAITIDVIDRNGNSSRESITTNNSVVTINKSTEGFVATIIFGQSNVELQLSVKLEGRDVVVHVPQEQIREQENARLASIQIYPFLGATKEDQVPGYMFIPDGAGALIRYGSDQVRMESPYRATIYGDNLGINNLASVSTVNRAFNATMPVFGMVHGVFENAILAIIENGDNYAEIIAQTAGLSTEFNWITAQFNYRYAYRQPTTQDEVRGPSIELFQEEKNSFDITLRYRILENETADYVGMALAYQAYLKEIGILTPLETTGPSMRLEFLGGELQQGLLWNTVVSMTPIADIPNFISRLQAQGLEDLLVVYRGWSRGGLTGSLPNRFPFERRLGSQSDVNEVVEQLATKNIPVFFHTDYSRAFTNSNNLFRGSNLAQQINTRTISGTAFDVPFNFLIPQQALEQARNDRLKFESYGMNKIALETTASTLYSVFNRGSEATRSENREILNELMYTLNAGDVSRTALYEPNAYAWGLTSHYFDIPMTSSGHLFVTDTVPFMHIVLRGYINYYAPVTNFSANQRQDLLRMIDYGAYPSFLLTSEPSHLLADTASRHIFTSEFDIWEETIVNHYQIVAEALSFVEGERIVSREVLAPGVVMIGYSNNVQIIVNYTSTTFTQDNLIVEAEGFVVVKGE